MYWYRILHTVSTVYCILYTVPCVRTCVPCMVLYITYCLRCRILCTVCGTVYCGHMCVNFCGVQDQLLRKRAGLLPASPLPLACSPRPLCPWRAPHVPSAPHLACSPRPLCPSPCMLPASHGFHARPIKAVAGCSSRAPWWAGSVWPQLTCHAWARCVGRGVLLCCCRACTNGPHHGSGVLPLSRPSPSLACPLSLACPPLPSLT